MISRALNAAAIKPFILSLLTAGDSYGYEIIKRVHEVTGGKVEWTTGTLYPVLHTLAADGLIEGYWQAADQGPRRRFYRITSKGLRDLKNTKREWLDIQRALDALWTHPSLAIGT